VYNRLMGTGNYSATSNNVKLVHWPLMDGLLQNVLMYNGPMLCGFNVPVEELKCKSGAQEHL